MEKGRNEVETVIYEETKFAMYAAKNDEPFSICDGFSKIVSNMSPDSKLTKKYGAGKTKTTQITKGKENHSSVLKKPLVNSVCLRR